MDNDIGLIAHLMRRAGFGANREQIGMHANAGYQNTVEALLNPGEEDRMDDHLIRRFHPELSGMMGPNAPGQNWLYRMATTSAPLREKMALFWHGIFATGYAKVIHGKALSDQTRMFRTFGMGSFKDLLIQLSKDPAMIIWLDNQDNHNGAINENFGRELLELFTMGVGNYTERDIKECARAFTGWTIANREYMELRSQRDSDWPYGRIAWHFKYHPEDHDDGEKEFLGQRGRFNGEDIIHIICQQEATARFISRHLYSFFVSDEPPIPEWRYTPPTNPEAIDELTRVYFDSSYDISAMLRALFNSSYFQSQDSWYSKVKSPVELVAGVLRLTGEFNRPRREIIDRYFQASYMGQFLNNPPSVEGWHQGTDWLDTGTLVERVNFASQQIGDSTKPGIQAMIERIASTPNNVASPENLISVCLEEMGVISVEEDTMRVLIDFASQGHDQPINASNDGSQKISAALQMVASTKEFQRS
ncbi:MAG: DUF1800 domain-containing protein [SAR324 cluster bacterium]|jgi:uncharacterized protein (DUF1800 family)|nr:DUF1800 domain-containing protein [SAR324 cluster bacterium]RTZ66195.1 MAG: hypothetical protein DSZ34_01365 [Gammaproteobacteria bacterium]